MKKTIMVLPGTVWQIPLIKKIKESGYSVAVVHPVENAPAFQFTDIKVLADILDVEAVLNAAKALNIVAIMSDECDIATPTLAYVSERLGLPSQGSDMAKLYTDKSLMRDFCREHDLPHPTYKVCSNLDEALEFYRNSLRNSKMIIKPIDANSSRGVYTIEKEQQLYETFNKSISYSHHKKAVICENFISGSEFSVDGIKMPDGHVSLAISEKTQFDYNKNLDNYLYFSYYNERYDYDKLRRINDEYVNKTKLPFGFTHAEYRFEDGEFYLLEIGARGGGNLISSHIVPALTGLDTYDILINMFTGQSINQKIHASLLATQKVAVLQFFDTTETGGIVKDIKGLDFLESNKDILYYQLNFKIGDAIKRPTDGGNRIGFYVACCNNSHSMKILQDEINERFSIIYE